MALAASLVAWSRANLSRGKSRRQELQVARISPGAWNPLAKIWGWEVFRNSFWFGMYPDILQPFFLEGHFLAFFCPGSWWLLWLLWLLRLLWLLWLLWLLELLAPMAHLSSIDQSISEACSPGACCALDTP